MLHQIRSEERSCTSCSRQHSRSRLSYRLSRRCKLFRRLLCQVPDTHGRLRNLWNHCGRFLLLRRLRSQVLFKLYLNLFDFVFARACSLPLCINIRGGEKDPRKIFFYRGGNSWRSIHGSSSSNPRLRVKPCCFV